MKNYYDTFGILPSSSQEEIKAVYRELSMKLHPDKNEGKPQYESLFKNLNEAYQVLGNEIKRREYDKKLKAEETNEKQSPPKPPPSQKSQPKPKPSENVEVVEYDGLCVDAIAVILHTQDTSARNLKKYLDIDLTRAIIILNQLEALKLLSPMIGFDRVIELDAAGVVASLTKQVDNFSANKFYIVLDKYREIIQVSKKTTQSTTYETPKTDSVWDEVKQWRTFRNVMWAVNILLVFVIFIKHSTSKQNSGEHSTSTEKINTPAEDVDSHTNKYDSKPREKKLDTAPIENINKSDETVKNEPFNENNDGNQPKQEVLVDPSANKNESDNSVESLPKNSTNEPKEKKGFFKRLFGKEESDYVSPSESAIIESFKIGDVVQFGRKNKTGKIVGKVGRYASLILITENGDGKSERVLFTELKKVD